MTIDPNRITKLSESPCYNCGCIDKCDERVRNNDKLGSIKDVMFGDKSRDYHNCGIWIALNAPEMIEVEE